MLPYGLFTAEDESSTADKHSTKKVNADVGIVLDEVLEEAPKWEVLRVSDSIFIYQFSFRQPAALITRSYITQELSVPIYLARDLAILTWHIYITQELLFTTSLLKTFILSKLDIYTMYCFCFQLLFVVLNVNINYALLVLFL